MAQDFDGAFIRVLYVVEKDQACFSGKHGRQELLKRLQNLVVGGDNTACCGLFLAGKLRNDALENLYMLLRHIALEVLQDLRPVLTVHEIAYGVYYREIGNILILLPENNGYMRQVRSLYEFPCKPGLANSGITLEKEKTGLEQAEHSFQEYFAPDEYHIFVSQRVYLLQPVIVAEDNLRGYKLLVTVAGFW